MFSMKMFHGHGLNFSVQPNNMHKLRADIIFIKYYNRDTWNNI